MAGSTVKRSGEIAEGSVTIARAMLQPATSTRYLRGVDCGNKHWGA